MTVSQIMEKMIRSSGGNIRDIEHFVKVWSYAKTIGELEKLDPETQFLLEVEAITHDIACPMCRVKYGNANGKLQEKESPALISAFLSDTGLTESQVERVSFVVGHHHTYEGGMAWIGKFCLKQIALSMHLKKNIPGRISTNSWKHMQRRKAEKS